MFEIIYTDNTTSKLTVAKNRTTLKIRKEDRGLGCRMIDMAEKIVDKLGEIEYTYRGRFTNKDSNMIIELFNDSKTKSKLFVEGKMK